MKKYEIYKVVSIMFVLSIMVLSLSACGKKDSVPEVKTMSSSQEELADYFKAKGYIAEDVTPVDINQTTGYLTDNTGGDFTETAVADEAYDYDGLWIFWWNQDEKTDRYEAYEGMKVNAGAILLQGGAAVLQTEAQNGAFAIAFAEDYADKDAVLADFKALAE